MLNLKRKIKEAIEITLISITKTATTLGVSFPKNIQALRKEVFLKIQRGSLSLSQINVNLLSAHYNKIDE